MTDRKTYPTFGFDRNKRRYDGERVKHILDYYFPEWSHVDGRMIEMAFGRTADDRELAIYMPREKNVVLRAEVDEDGYGHFTVRLALEDDIDAIARLWKTGDVLNDRSDKRFFTMVQDWERKSNDVD